MACFESSNCSEEAFVEDIPVGTDKCRPFLRLAVVLLGLEANETFGHSCDCDVESVGLKCEE